MKKLMLLILTLGLFLFMCSGPASAFEQRVYDEAGLFDPEQITGLESKISVLISQIGMDIVAVTADDTGGKSAMEYADDFYDENSFGLGADKSGALLLIDMDNREVYISTCGDMIRYLTDRRIESILDTIYTDTADGNFYDVVEGFLGMVKHYVEEGIPEDQYTYDSQTGEIIRERSLTPTEIIIALIIACAAGLICCLVVLGKYRLKISAFKYPFREKSSMNLTRVQDIFINRTHTQRKIQSSSSGSGGSGSSTHKSSSGTRHGGGGRKF